MSGAIAFVRRHVNLPALLLAALAMALIWGNSMVPGTGSSSLSLTVTEAVRSALAALGLPSAWVTNLLVRKAAHVTEYLVLGVLTSQALDPRRATARDLIALSVVICVLGASIDETIQLFVPGRSGQVADVLIDSCGIVAGVVLRTVVVRLRARRG